MALSDLVNVQITSNAASPTRPGFGTPLLAAYHTHWPQRTRTYKTLSAMVADGFLTTDPAYLMAQAVAAQSPRVKSWKVGRLALPATQTFSFTCAAPAATGTIYSLTVKGTVCSYTSIGGDTATTVAIALEALAAAVSGITGAVPTTATFSIHAAAGVVIQIKDVSSNISWAENSLEPGVATDLAAIAAADSDWYGFSLDQASQLMIEAAALWAEANKKLFLCETSDTICADPGFTNDTLSHLKTAAYVRTHCTFVQHGNRNYVGPALMGKVFPNAPGSDTWAYKTLATVTADGDNLTDAMWDAVKAKNGNVYQTVAGVNFTLWGVSPSGEYLDNTRGVDWTRSEMQIRLLALFLNNKKLPFTDLGVDAAVSVIDGVLQDGVKVGLWAATPAPQVFAPKVADVSVLDRTNRNLPDIAFTATYAGAIHTIDPINGTVSV